MATAVAIWTMMAQPLPKSSARRPCVTPAASSSSGAALEKRPAASTCIPKPKASFIACLTACGRWVPSLDNACGEGVVSGPSYFTHLHCRRADQDIESSMHRRQTAGRSWSIGRYGSLTARGALHSMPAAISEPLSSSARPSEARRARGQTRRRHSAFVSGHVAICA